MIPAPWMLKLAGVAVVALALYGLYWSIDNGGYERGVSEMTSKYRDAEIKRDKEQAERNKTAQENHDADQKTIARLAADARRVRVNFPVCFARSGGEGTDGGGGVLSARVDELFAELQSRTGSLIERCDQINIDAIRQNASLP